ncbi:MAG: porin family protein [bacterium]
MSIRVPVSLVALMLIGLVAAVGAGESRALSDLNFGGKIGLSVAQQQGIEERDMEYTVASGWRRGFAASAFICFPVTARFGLQTEVGYAQKGSRQDIGVDTLDLHTVLHVTYNMDYLEVMNLMRFAWLKSDCFEFYSLAGTGFGLKMTDRYRLRGVVTDGEQVVPLWADSDMSEVDLFDYSLVYGTGLALPLWGRTVLVEYRFTLGWNTLGMPTYAYVQVGDESAPVKHEPVPLKNQNHLVLVGITF